MIHGVMTGISSSLYILLGALGLLLPFLLFFFYTYLALSRCIFVCLMGCDVIGWISSLSFLVLITEEVS